MSDLAREWARRLLAPTTADIDLATITEQVCDDFTTDHLTLDEKRTLAREIDDLVRSATITVTWPDNPAHDYDNDPAALAWARAKVAAKVDRYERATRRSADSGGPFSTVAQLYRRDLIGGEGCIVAAFDERIPGLNAAMAAAPPTTHRPDQAGNQTTEPK